MDSFQTSKQTRLRRTPLSFLVTSKKPLPESNDKLCSTCSKINFKKLFEPSKGRPPPDWNRVFSACAAAANIDCPFCILLWHLSVAKMTSGGNPSPGSKINLKVEFDKMTITNKLVDIYIPHMTVDANHACTNSIHLIPEPDAYIKRDYTSYLFRARQLSSYVDIELLQHWLDVCEQSHEKCRKSHTTEDFQHSIRVIDIKKRYVVEAPAKCKYVALSYVWGNQETRDKEGRKITHLKLLESTTSRLLAPGGLAESFTDVPFTIVDAMKVCSMLGRDYLWVDALCIIQDDPQDRDRQIQQMDQIYALADLTIVSAHKSDLPQSSHSWSGLSGVREERPIHERQHIVKIGEQQFGNLATWRFMQQAGVFDWSRRAWTMQEMYLSDRMIYFADLLAFYQCRETLWREDQYLECDRSVRIENKQYDGDGNESEIQYIKESRDRTGTDPFQKYCQLVTGICSRGMTNPGDILDAFTGIANTFSSSMNCPIVWGLPTAFFDYALLFEPWNTVRICRRPGFPSWSWTGWKEHEQTHGAYFGSLLVYYDDLDDYITFGEVDWYSSLSNDQKNSNGIHHEDQPFVKINNSKIPKASNIGVLDTIRSSWRPAYPLDRSSIPCELTKEERKMLLILQTSCATIDVVYNSCALGGVYDTLLSSDGLKRTINLRRQTAEMSRHRIQRVQRDDIEIRKVDFMVLGTVMLKEDLNNEVSAKNVYLKLMAIETDYRGISQRIGIVNDKVAVCDWVAYGPQWRTVFLL